MINAYAKDALQLGRKNLVPEAFVWHALIGLCDGLAYLQNGPPSKAGSWIPVLHRDIKPDNVLLKSRSTVSSNKYPYCVLSDFALACEDRPDHDPEADQYQVSRLKLGTKLFWAPELCYTPGPRYYSGEPSGEGREHKYWPAGFRHSQKSDVWALGASIYNLCAPKKSCISHINFNLTPPRMTQEEAMEGTKVRINPLTIPSNYTDALRDALTLATTWDPKYRPRAVDLLAKLRVLNRQSGFENHAQAEPLPAWATRVHEYMGKAEALTQRASQKASQNAAAASAGRAQSILNLRK